MSDEKYRAILERDPTDTQAFVALCNSAERNNDYQYLAQLYDFRAQVIADTKEIADLYFRSGEIYLDKLGETAKGVELLLKGFDADRTHAGIGDKLDAIYREAGDWESAVQIVEQRLEALSGADTNGTKTVIRSDLHQQAGEIWEKVYADRKRALAHYKRAIELDKTNLPALYGAREIYYQAGKFRNASKLCELEARAEKDLERRSALYRELSQIYEKKLEDIEQAVISLKRALKAMPESIDVQSDLARLIAQTPWTREAAKDHLWATEYLLRQAADVSGLEAVELASLAVVSTPTSTKAMDFLEAGAQESGNFVRLAAIYEEILAKIPNSSLRNTLIGRLAALYQFRLGDESRAAQWRAGIQQEDDSFQVLGSEESYQSLMPDNPMQAGETSSMPPAPHMSGSRSSISALAVPRSSIPAPMSVPSAPMSVPGGPSIPIFSSTPSVPAPYAAPGSMPGRPAAVYASVQAPAQQAVSRAPVFDAPTSTHEAASSGTVTVPIREPGVSNEDFAETLRQASDRARRVGDDATAELCLLQVLDLFPHDQKAITFLERRFRARSDWFSLRDLLLRSAGSPHLPLAVQTVRLREAARLSEEQLGDVQGAIVAWNQIKNNDPKVRDAVDALIRLLEQAGQWSELRIILLQEIETTKSRTKKAEAYRKLAEIYHLHTADLESAADAYQNVLELAPEETGAMEALEEIYLKTGKYDQVVSLLRKRADFSQNRAEKRDLLFRGAQVLRENLDRLEDAYAQAREVLTLSKDDKEVLAFLTALDEEGGHWSRLINVLDVRIHAVSSTDEKLQLLRKKAACALEKLGDTRAAIQTLNGLLALSPDDIEAMDSLIGIYRQAGDWESLVRTLKSRIAASADRTEQAMLHRECARVLEGQLGKEDEAMVSWKAVLEIEADAESLGALARYYERNQQWDAFTDVIERQASYTEDHHLRADILFNRAVIMDTKLKNRPRAIAELQRILKEVDPAHDGTLHLLIDIMVQEKRFTEAADLLDQRISYSQDKNAAKTMLLSLGGWCRNELNDLERAMDAYEKAVQLDKDDSAVLNALDEVYTALHEWDKLLKLLYARAKTAPDDEARFALLIRGAEVCEVSLADKKKAWTWHIEILDKLGHMKEAVDQVEQAARRMELWKELIDLAGVMTKKAETVPEQVEWWLKAADVLEERMDEANQALEAVLRAFGLEPDNEALLDRVDRLAVSVGNWQRLSTVYGVLVNRSEDKTRKIDLLTRYAVVLRDKAHRASDAFEISIKAFEMDPDSETLLQMVEEMGRASERWDDLVRIYNGCAKLASDTERKVALKIRAAFMLRNQKVDPDGALMMILEALRIDPFDGEITARLWKEIDALESDLVPTEAGTYWKRTVELYRVLVDENNKDPEKCFELLCKLSEIYLDKLKDMAAAFEVLKENQSINPKDERNLDKLEELAAKNSYWHELVDHYQDVLDETFDMKVAVMLHRRRGLILQDHLGKPEEAAEHFWQIIQLDSSDVGAYEALVAYYQTSRKWNNLVNILERQLDNTKDNDAKRTILLRIGGIWENEIGNRYEAKDWYEQAVALRPDDEEANAALQRLTKGEGFAGGDSTVSDDDDNDADDDDDLRALISIPPPPPDTSEEDETESSPAEAAPLPSADTKAEDRTVSSVFLDDDLDAGATLGDSLSTEDEISSEDEEEEGVKTVPPPSPPRAAKPRASAALADQTIEDDFLSRITDKDDNAASTDGGEEDTGDLFVEEGDFVIEDDDPM